MSCSGCRALPPRMGLTDVATRWLVLVAAAALVLAALVLAGVTLELVLVLRGGTGGGSGLF